MNSKIKDNKGNVYIRDYKIESTKSGDSTWYIKSYFFVKLPNGSEIPDREYHEIFLRNTTEAQLDIYVDALAHVYLYALMHNTHIDDTPVRCRMPEPIYDGTWDSGD